MQSVLGTILDPAADKALMATLTVTLSMKGLLPGMLTPNCEKCISMSPTQFLWLQLSWVETPYSASQPFITVSYPYHPLYVPFQQRCGGYTNLIVDNQRTFARYWDFSMPSAEVKPTTISKVSASCMVT